MSGTTVLPGGPAGMSQPVRSRLRFELLGPQRAWYADCPIDLGPGKQRAVLAVLLLSAGRPVPTGQIVDAVWPDEPPANGPNVVQKYVAGLRRVLEPDRSPRTPGQVLTLTDAGYLLRVPPEAVDAVRFERGVQRARQRHTDGRADEALAELTAALELWQGEPFTGFAGPYFEAARHRLVELRAVALETRAELALESGRHRELVGELVELIAEFPVRERLRHQLMLALHRSGRQAEALAAYREFADLLREEHGIEPGEALQELHGRILRSDPALHLTVPGPGPTAAGPDAGPPAVPSPGSMVAQPDARWPATVPAPRSGPAEVAIGAPAALGPVYLVGLPQPSGGWAEQPSPGWVRFVATVVGTAITLLSFGALTWAVVLAYALWRRSWRLALAGAGYFLIIAGMVVVALRMPDTDELSDLEVLYLLGALATCWLLGAAHVVLLNPTLGSWARRLLGSDSQRVAEERQLRREQARYLLQHYPAARHELRIGRPDLPRTFDDGGLVDINAVDEQVIAGLPGLTAAQSRHVAMERWVRGPFGSMEDLAARCLLPPALTNSLRDILVFLPPPTPKQS